MKASAKALTRSAAFFGFPETVEIEMKSDPLAGVAMTAPTRAEGSPLNPRFLAAMRATDGEFTSAARSVFARSDESGLMICVGSVDPM